jgi:hypothetical protein
MFQECIPFLDNRSSKIMFLALIMKSGREYA